jgi:hypothetical protein
MEINMRISLVALLLCSSAALADAPAATVKQGGVAMWNAYPASECGIYGKRYPAVAGACYYPVDIETKIGSHEIALWEADGTRHLGALKVEAGGFDRIDMELPKAVYDEYVDVSEANLQRHEEDRKHIREHVFNREITAPQFELPLMKPADPLPKSEDDFGNVRVFLQSTDNDDHDDTGESPHTSLHTGRDFPVNSGTSLKAPAAGVVALAEDQFFTGNAVYLDHGDGLVSMFFHLSEVDVATGDKVERGQTIGKVGATGRATGPHMHIGVRWLEQRIDPLPLFDDPQELATVTTAGGTENTAGRSEPPEDDSRPKN